ncbi:MAG: PPC domain-containing protein [Ginsengibacter sp.]
MKHLHLMLIMAFVLEWKITYATETEPNNTAAQANTLALTGSNTGKINPSGGVDWWKVTTTGDGKLNIKFSTTSGKYTWIYLYDNNSTTLLDSGNSNSTFLRSKDGLAAGTYYIKIRCVSATDTTSYTISNTLTLPAVAKRCEW